MDKREFNAGVLFICVAGALSVAGIVTAIEKMGDLVLVGAIVIAVPTAIGLACIVIRDIRRVCRSRRENEKRPPIGPTAEEVARAEMAKRLAGWPQKGKQG